MKTLRLFPLELGRLLRSRLTWLVMLLPSLALWWGFTSISRLFPP